MSKHFEGAYEAGLVALEYVEKWLKSPEIAKGGKARYLTLDFSPSPANEPAPDDQIGPEV